jgi:hypothetical protein
VIAVEWHPVVIGDAIAIPITKKLLRTDVGPGYPITIAIEKAREPVNVKGLN